MEDAFKSTEECDEAIRAAEERLDAANQPGGDASDRPRAHKAKLNAEAAKRRLRKQAEQATESALRTSKDYPVKALGPTLASITDAIARRVQCAPSMVATSILATVSLAAQAVADVGLPDGQVVPLSLFAVVIAASGDRKTGVDKFVTRPIELREGDLRKAYAEGISAYTRKKAVWDSARKKILNSPAVVAVKEEMLKALGDEPVAPRKPQLTTADGTQEGLIEAFKVLPPAIGLFTGEGGQFFCGYGFTPERKGATGAAFSTFWDAGRLRKARVGTGVTDLGGRRLAMNIMVQPDIAKEMVTDRALVDQGFVARLLLVEPKSHQGYRPYGNRDKSPAFNRAMGMYNHDMENLFEAAETKDDAGAELVVRVMELSEAAVDAYDAYGNEVEIGLRPGGRYARIKATAAKSAEQAARIAGALTLFGHAGATTISDEAMKRGVTLARFYLEEALRLFEAAVHTEVTLGQELLDWVVALPLAAGERGWTVTARDVQRRGPNKLRTRAKDVQGIFESLVNDGAAFHPGASKSKLFVPRPTLQ